MTHFEDSFVVYSPLGEFVAECKHAEDAACLVALYGEGATIRPSHDHKRLLWLEGQESYAAAESYDFVRETVHIRLYGEPMRRES